MTNRVLYDRELMRDDMAIRAWLQTDIARRSKLSDDTISKFFRGMNNSVRTAKAIAKALGHPVSRYLISARKGVAA